MGMNIKSHEAHKLAHELAEITGESLTTAVTVAVQERLERVRVRKSKEGLADRLMAIGRECAARMPDEYRNMNPDDWLYDERGLPK